MYIDLENKDMIEDYLGWFWDYQKLLIKKMSLEDYEITIKDPEELEYFYKFKESTIGKFYSKLTFDEIKSISDYSANIASLYKDINYVLRNDITYDLILNNKIRHIDNAMNKFELNMPIKLYRAIKTDMLSFLNINSIEDIYKLEGTEYTEKGYMSCSLTHDGSYASFNGYDIVFDIEVDENTPGMYIEFLKPVCNSYEFLLARGTTLEIKSIEKIGNKYYLKSKVKNRILEKEDNLTR